MTSRGKGPLRLENSPQVVMSDSENWFVKMQVELCDESCASLSAATGLELLELHYAESSNKGGT